MYGIVGDAAGDRSPDAQVSPGESPAPAKLKLVLLSFQGLSKNLRAPSGAFERARGLSPITVRRPSDGVVGGALTSFRMLCGMRRTLFPPSTRPHVSRLPRPSRRESNLRCRPAARRQRSPSAQQHYLFSYFTGNGEDGLHFAHSTDGYKWTAINGGKSLLKPTAGSDKLMRDPSIVRGPDGTFHMVWTVSWGERGIGYSSSQDLIHWDAAAIHPRDGARADGPQLLGAGLVLRRRVASSSTSTGRRRFPGGSRRPTARAAATTTTPATITASTSRRRRISRPSRRRGCATTTVST